MSTLAALTRLGESTVRRQFDLLCGLGWLVKTAAASGNRWHGDGSGRPAQYRLNIPNSATPVAPTEVKGRQPGSTDSSKRCYEEAVTELPEGSNGATARHPTRETRDRPAARAGEDAGDDADWRVLREAAELATAHITDPQWSVDQCRLALGALDRDGTIRTDPLRSVRHYVTGERRELVRGLETGLLPKPTPTPPPYRRDPGPPPPASKEARAAARATFQARGRRPCCVVTEPAS